MNKFSFKFITLTLGIGLLAGFFDYLIGVKIEGPIWSKVLHNFFYLFLGGVYFFSIQKMQVFKKNKGSIRAKS